MSQLDLINNNDIGKKVLSMAEWFLRNQTSTGDFVYRRRLIDGQILKKNNIVRQAGSLYALAQLYNYLTTTSSSWTGAKQPDPGSRWDMPKVSFLKDLENTIISGFSYFQSVATKTGKNEIAIEHKGYTKTNTNALLILALVEYLEAKKLKKRKNEKQKNLNPKTYNLIPLTYNLVNHLLSMQQPDGTFMYRPDINRKSDFNNGECLYALIRAYQLFKKHSQLNNVIPNPTKRHPQLASETMQDRGSRRNFLKASEVNNLLQATILSANHFITKYKPGKNRAFYPWAMAGYTYLYQETKQEKYWQYIQNATRYYLERRIKKILQRLHQPFACWACSLESLTHVAWISREKTPQLYDEIKQKVEAILASLITLHITNSPYKNINGTVALNHFKQTCRIDMTQHVMSALLLYLKFIF